MSTDHHDPLAFGGPLTSAAMEAPLGQLDAALETVIATVGSGGWATTLDGTANSGQKVVPVTSTTGAVVGMPVYLGATSGTHEVGVIASISAGVSVTLVANLVSAYASGVPITATPAEVADARGTSATLGARLTADLADAAAKTGAVDATQRFLKRIIRGLEDITLVVLGDSTGNASDEWVYLLAQSLGAAYPTHTVKYALWDDGSQAYPAASTLATGSGARTINVWNCSVAGIAPVYHLVGGELMYGAKDPDLVIISHGHNETGIGYGVVRDRMLSLTETILARCPKTAVILIAQNPNTTDDYMGFRASEYERIAQMRGFGLIDVHQAFVDYGAWAADLMTDTVHPNAAGQALWLATVLRAFTYYPNHSPRPQPTSTLFSTAWPQILANGDLATFVTPPTLTSWTATAATLTKDTTAGHWESTKGWAVRLVATSAAASNIYQAAGGGNAFLDAVRGQWITLAARIRVAAVSASATAGRVQIQDNLGNTSSPGIGRYDGFFWAVVSRYIDPAATSIQATIYGDTAANANADISVDRVILCRGILPRDIQ